MANKIFREKNCKSTKEIKRKIILPRLPNVTLQVSKWLFYVLNPSKIWMILPDLIITVRYNYFEKIS